MQSRPPHDRITEGRWFEPDQAGRYRFILNAEPTSDWSHDRPAAE